MSMDVGGAKGGLKADINVTPLVDVMLVLLIIMMLIAPMLQKGVDVKLPQAANSVDKPETQDQIVVAITADKGMYVNAMPVREDDLRQKVQDALETKKEKIVLIKGDEDAPVLRHHVGHGSAARGTDREHRPRDRTQDPGRQHGRSVMAHAHQHFGAEKVTRGRDPAGQRGHERHAADRRAARAADHLHGGAAAHAEGDRHQPAARDEDGQPGAGRYEPDRARVHAPIAGSRSTSRTVTIPDLENRLRTIYEQRKDKTMFIAGAPTRCATARSSRSSTRRAARASRRSASSPPACARRPAWRAAGTSPRAAPRPARTQGHDRRAARAARLCPSSRLSVHSPTRPGRLERPVQRPARRSWPPARAASFRRARARLRPPADAAGRAMAKGGTTQQATGSDVDPVACRVKSGAAAADGYLTASPAAFFLRRASALSRSWVASAIRAFCFDGSFSTRACERRISPL